MAKKYFFPPEASRATILPTAGRSPSQLQQQQEGRLAGSSSSGDRRRKTFFTRRHLCSLLWGLLFLFLTALIGIGFQGIQNLIQNVLR